MILFPVFLIRITVGCMEEFKNNTPQSTMNHEQGTNTNTSPKEERTRLSYFPSPHTDTYTNILHMKSE